MIFRSLKGLRGQSHKGVESTNHWIIQRFTSILLIPLSILFVVNFVRVFDKPFIEVLKTFQHPVNNLVALLFILISLWHYRQGIEVVIEDYVHDLGKRNLRDYVLVSCYSSNFFFCNYIQNGNLGEENGFL